jgi:hypothetical protein
MVTVASAGRTEAGRRWARLAAVGGGSVVVTALAWALAAGTRDTRWHSWSGDRDLRALSFWLASSVSEPQFYASASASACLLVGGLVAHVARRRGWPWAGFVQACGTGIWPAVAGSALCSLVLGNLVWGWTLGEAAWQPLFVPLVSVAPAMVVLYGPDWRTGATATVLGGLVTPPLAVVAVEWVCGPLDLPPVVGATGAMGLGALVAFWVARHLPWMPHPGAWRADMEVPVSPPTNTRSGAWLMRRALADFSEAQFFGNEWASAAMLVGALVAYTVNPSGLVYGSGLFGAVLVSQVLTALTGVVVWRRRWEAHGFHPTFVPVVSVAPAAVLACGGSVPSILAGALAGALLGPPVAAAISARLPADFHPFIGNVLSMSLCTAAVVPVLELIPGFTS